ncbi:MAG: hypothetical protein QOK04_2405 [Solirubrobacteraceae bacterium]|nr:hypothetical protein [Solirubrobacteraceae bacterium]
MLALAGAALLALSTAGLAACADGGSKRPSPLRPTETIRGFVVRLQSAATAIQEGRCDDVSAFNRYAPFALGCDVTAQRAYGRFKVLDSALFGTGGVVDFTDTELPRGGTYVVGLDAKREYSIILGAPVGERTVGTVPRSVEAFDRAAASWVTGIRRKNCDQYYANAFTAPGLTKQQACREAFDASSEIQPQLAADKRAAPRRLGGTAHFAFYALASKADHYRTLVVARVPPANYLTAAIRAR